ncbi:ABC transporter ATP-binding protein [Sphaerisporangium dianthi]|uniref:ABC transporter ATP-binding protein n=1 Tax=Sphaerisporangium dianthi TaxID=1436120 RepID=A0ABV9CV22_9ACTN
MATTKSPRSRETAPGDGAPPAEGAAPTPRRMLLRLLRPHRAGLTAVLAFQIVGSLAGLAPLIAVVELGRILLGPGPADHGAAWTAVWIGVAGLAVRVALATAAGGVAHLVDGRLALSLRRRLARDLGRVPLGWFSRHSSGEIKGVVQNDVDQLHYLIAHTPVEATAAIVVPVASLAYLVWVDWRLTLVALIPVVLGLLLRRMLMTPARQEQGREMGQAMGRVGAAAVEFVEGIAVVKTFGGGRSAHRRYRRASEDFADFFLGYVAGSGGLASLAALVLSPPFVLLVVLTGGAALIGAGSLPPADLLPFLLLSVALTTPVAALAHGMDNIHAAERSAERIHAMLAVPPLPEPSRPAEPRGDRVEFRDVFFSYEPGRPVLRGVGLVLEPGTTTALVGPSGSGKSTLAQLLPRFHDPDAGAVLIGGADVRDIPAQRLYRAVSFVFQDVRLLRASVADNIALAVPEALPEDIVRVAQAAGIHDRIITLPKGYDSVVGDDIRLSGGEAQRLSIARALLVDAPVLVLDEAMAFADVKTEAEIRAALNALRRGRTQLVIAHRLETVTRADRIAVLDEGRVVEIGDYRELLERDGRFAEMWRVGHTRTEKGPHW